MVWGVLCTFKPFNCFWTDIGWLDNFNISPVTGHKIIMMGGGAAICIYMIYCLGSTKRKRKSTVVSCNFLPNTSTMYRPPPPYTAHCSGALVLILCQAKMLKIFLCIITKDSSPAALLVYKLFYKLVFLLDTQRLFTLTAICALHGQN